MMNRLKGKRVAILVTDGFEQVEMTNPRKALDEAGAVTTLISPKSGEVQGWNHDEKADRLRTIPEAVKFAKSFFGAHKPIAAICHGPWLLVEADVVRGYKMTSWPSLKADLTNAGAQWTDSPVVVDRGLISSRKPDDLPSFNEKMLEEFSHQHVHA